MTSDRWAVRVVILAVTALADSVRKAIVNRLGHYDAALKVGHRSLAFNVTVRAESADGALAQAVSVWKKIAAEAGLGEYQILTLNVMPATEREEGEGDSGDSVIGVAELAQLFGVSKPRAREIAQRPEFPQPIARLRATTVWDTEEVYGFMAYWRRNVKRQASSSKSSMASGDGETAVNGNVPTRPGG